MNRTCKGWAFSFFAILLISLCLSPVVFATAGYSGQQPGGERDTAATGEELLDWLHNSRAGTLMLTADITLGDAKVLRSFGDGAVVDAGNYSITITGGVQLLCEGLTVTGTGGADGLLRVQPGAMLELGYCSVTAQNGGTALSQAEGAGLLVGGECTVVGDVRYAQTPFVWYWNESPLVVVSAAQTAQLPQTVSAQVNVQGKMERRDVPVQWALDEHEQAQAQRRRFYAKGSADGCVMATPAVCTVAYDDYPLTFTKVTAKEQSWCYSVAGGFTKPAAALPITVAEEYSFDGDNWTTYYERTIANQYDGFSIELQKDEDEEHCWNIANSPQLYIRLRWMDGATAYYSNVLRLAAGELDKAEDIGGNRGGGTDITDPPTTPTPDPPGNDNSNGGDNDSDNDSSSSTPPAPQRPDSGGTPPPVPQHPNSGVTPPPNSGVTPPPPEPQQGSGVLPIAVGGTVVAACMAAAALCLYPQARKRLWARLQKLVTKK